MQLFRFAAWFALAVTAIGGPAPAFPPDLAPPDEPRPFNVGVTTFPAEMTGGRVTLIHGRVLEGVPGRGPPLHALPHARLCQTERP
jgi:hypothetical protein